MLYCPTVLSGQYGQGSLVAIRLSPRRQEGCISLDRTSQQPLWSQLADQLRARISVDGFQSGLPTEQELMEAYAVSRHTVRAALKELRDSGLVERQRGRGTFVASSTSLEQPLRGIYSLSDAITGHGRSERSEVLAAGRRRAGEVAHRLGLGRRELLVSVTRLRFVDDDPVVLSTAWYPIDVGQPLLELDLSQGSLYEHLARHSGLRVTGGWERIRAALPTASERRSLLMPPTEAVLAIERLATAGSRTVEWRTSVMRGDRYSLFADWTEPRT